MFGFSPIDIVLPFGLDQLDHKPEYPGDASVCYALQQNLEPFTELYSLIHTK